MTKESSIIHLLLSANLRHVCTSHDSLIL